MNTHFQLVSLADAGLDRFLAVVARGSEFNEHGAGWWHAGDVVWGLFHIPEKELDKHAWLVVDDAGRDVGYCVFHPSGQIDFHVPDDIDDVAGVTGFIVEQAIAASTAETLSVEFLTHQEICRDVLSQAGFAYAEPGFSINVMPLDQEIPAPTQRVRSFEEADTESRVALHQNAFESTRYQEAGHRLVRTKPIYRQDLDLVAVTPDDELAAFCMVWFDPVTNTGLFEPVGTSSRHRRQGYGTSVLREGLIRLRVLGATKAIVLNETESDASGALYPAVGFRPTVQIEMWERGVRMEDRE